MSERIRGVYIVYISGPITDVADYKERFAAAEDKLKSNGYAVINPAAISGRLPRLAHEDYMRLSHVLLETSDAICMINGWGKSLGANREYGYALGRGMPILRYDETTDALYVVENALREGPL